MRVRPSQEEVRAHQGNHTHVVLSLELLADVETPISLYQKIAHGQPFSFLLESAEGGERFGRYSFMGADPALVFEFSDGEGKIHRQDAVERVRFEDPLAVLESLTSAYRVAKRPDLPRFLGGAVGALGFDCVRYFEKVPLAAAPSTTSGALPEGFFFLAERLVVVDHLKHRLILTELVLLDGDRDAEYARAAERLYSLARRIAQTALPVPVLSFEDAPAVDVASVEPRRTYEDAVRAAKTCIREGEIFQVVLSQPYSVRTDLASLDVYRALRALNPSPYLFHLQFRESAVVGASPEVLVRLEDGHILLRPIAGTRPRGRTPEEDRALEDELLADAKEIAEHRMLVDLGRNDVGRVAEIGSVLLEAPLHIERYSHVMHIVSDVRGTLAPGKSAFDVFRACFPAGTVSGAPKIRAIEIIARLEARRRGLYAGAVGYFDFGGNMDTCIAIRTLVCTPGAVHVQAGAGVVHGSDPQREHEECDNKARACLLAVRLAEAMRQP